MPPPPPPHGANCLHYMLAGLVFRTFSFFLPLAFRQPNNLSFLHQLPGIPFLQPPFLRRVWLPRIQTELHSFSHDMRLVAVPNVRPCPTFPRCSRISSAIIDIGPRPELKRTYNVHPLAYEALHVTTANCELSYTLERRFIRYM